MKLKTKLLLAISMLLVPEMLLVWYLESSYKLYFDLSGVPTTDFLTFLFRNPVIIILNIFFAIAFLILYRMFSRK
jgi:hypothetical protein